MSHPFDDLPSSDGYARWDEAGNTVKGIVTHVGIGQDLNGNDCPQIIVQTDSGDVTVTASQAQLRAKLREARPNTGDRIVIVYSGDEKRAGGKTLKQFDVAVKAGDGAASDSDDDAVLTPAAKPSAADLL